MEMQFFTDLWTVLDLVHDRWFDLTEVSFNKDRGEVCVFLREQRRGSCTDRRLQITGVLDFEVKDEAKIGRYDLADIEIDSSSSTLRIKSGFPLVISMKMAGKCSLSVLRQTELKGR
jgi:hypothetical protein